VHLVARTEDALGVAEVRALDLDDIGQTWRAIAAGREHQPPNGFRVAGKQPLGGPPCVPGDSHK
jgi:hypothetical protein